MALNHTYTVARDTLLRGGTQPRGSASMLLRLFQRQHHSGLFYTEVWMLLLTASESKAWMYS